MWSHVLDASFSVARCLMSLLLSPWGYVKELLGLTVLLAGFAWALTAVSTSLPSKDEHQHAAAAAQVRSVSRMLLLPEDGRICLYQNLRELVTIDESHGAEQSYQALPAADYLELHNLGHAWGYLVNRIDTGFEWWNSMQGKYEIPAALNQTKVRSISLSKQQNIAAVLSVSREVQLWRPNTEGVIDVIASFDLPDCDWIYLSPTGDVLAVRSDRRLRFLDSLTGKEIGSSVQLKDLVTCHCWSPEGSYFACAMHDGEILVCPVYDTEDLPISIKRPQSASAIALSSNGSWLIGATSCGEQFAFQQGELCWNLPAHRNNIRALAIAGHQDQVVSSGMDGKVSIRSLETGRLLREFTP